MFSAYTLHDLSIGEEKLELVLLKKNLKVDGCILNDSSIKEVRSSFEP